MSEDRFSGGMRCLIDDFGVRGSEALALRSRTFGARAGSAEAEPRAEMFLTVDPRDRLDGLDSSIQITPQQGSLRVASAPLSRLDELAAHPAVHKVQIARYLHPALDQAADFIGVPILRTRTGADGSGVLIGIVDSGIDGSHPAFGDRILRVWDQTVAGPGVEEGAGLELRGVDTRNATDTSGHGTHVAGIAAGEDATYRGIAPGAKLAIVRTDFLDTNIALGVRYLQRVAREERLQLVVNLSLGGHLDAHDGSDELSQAVDEVSGEGRIVCCAAGNEGEAAIHASVTLASGGVKAITFEVKGGRELAVLNGWYSGQDEIDVSVEDPSGRVTPFQSAIAEANQLRRYELGPAVVQAVTPFADRRNSDKHFHIQLSQPGGLALGIWKLRLSGRVVRTGVVHVWSTDKHGDVGIPFTSCVDDSMKVGSPGCAAEAITVGNYASRLRYRAESGVSVVGDSFLFPDCVVPGSSPGPTRDGRAKPEILAPGAVLVSALSSQSAVGPLQKVAGPFRAMEGTSMSCAVVSGLLALLLERWPGLTPQNARDRLVRVASMRRVRADTPAQQAGAGLIDASRL